MIMFLSINWWAVAAIFFALAAARLWLAVGRARLNAWVLACPDDAAPIVKAIWAGHTPAYRVTAKAVLLWPLYLGTDPSLWWRLNK